MRGSNTLAELDFDVVFVPDCEPLCDPELFAVPVIFAVPELLALDSSLSWLSSWLSLLLLSPVGVAVALPSVREPLALLSPDLLVALSFTSDERPDEALLEESSWRWMSRGAISLLRASTGLLSMEGHADVVAARSRTEERTAEGFMVAPTVYSCSAESSGCRREGCV